MSALGLPSEESFFMQHFIRKWFDFMLVFSIPASPINVSENWLLIYRAPVR
jgi:hypothetical protein